jgi:hypothetical protein
VAKSGHCGLRIFECRMARLTRACHEGVEVAETTWHALCSGGVGHVPNFTWGALGVEVGIRRGNEERDVRAALLVYDSAGGARRALHAGVGLVSGPAAAVVMFWLASKEAVVGLKVASRRVSCSGSVRVCARDAVPKVGFRAIRPVCACGTSAVAGGDEVLVFCGNRVAGAPCDTAFVFVLAVHCGLGGHIYVGFASDEVCECHCRDVVIPGVGCLCFASRGVCVDDSVTVGAASPKCHLGQLGG